MPFILGNHGPPFAFLLSVLGETRCGAGSPQSCTSWMNKTTNTGEVMWDRPWIRRQGQATPGSIYIVSHGYLYYRGAIQLGFASANPISIGCVARYLGSTVSFLSVTITLIFRAYSILVSFGYFILPSLGYEYWYLNLISRRYANKSVRF